MIIIGVDPGLTGALAVFIDGKFCRVHDMPVKQKGKSRRVRSLKTGNMRTVVKYEVDGFSLGDTLHRIIRDLESFPEDCFVFIEQVNARPDQGVSSMFSFGDSFGVARGICEYLFGNSNVYRVRPQDWKKSTGLSGLDKDAARWLARGLYPDSREFLERKKDSGRADAIMIAHHGWEKLNAGNN